MLQIKYVVAILVDKTLCVHENVSLPVHVHKPACQYIHCIIKSLFVRVHTCSLFFCLLILSAVS